MRKLRAPQAAAPPSRRRPILRLIGLGSVAIAAAILLWIFIPKKAGPPEFEISRLTFDSGLTWTPAFSPDGKMIAYASDRGGGDLDIWVQQLAGGTPLRLTTDPADDNIRPFPPTAPGSFLIPSGREAGSMRSARWAAQNAGLPDAAFIPATPRTAPGSLILRFRLP